MIAGSRGLIEPRQPEERAEDEGDALGLYFADIARGALPLYLVPPLTMFGQ